MSIRMRAWGGANGKAGAILIRITLDNVQGAKWQHSTNNGNRGLRIEIPWVLLDERSLIFTGYTDG